MDYGTIETGSRRIKMGEVAVWFGEMMENIRIAVLTGLSQKTKSFPGLTNGEWTERQRPTAAVTTGVKPVSRKAAPAAKRAIAEKNIAGGKKSSTSGRILLAFYFICFYISVLTERWQSGRMRLTRNQLYSSRGTQGSNPCLSASLIRKTPDIGRYSITAFFCVSNFLSFKSLYFLRI